MSTSQQFTVTEPGFHLLDLHLNTSNSCSGNNQVLAYVFDPVDLGENRSNCGPITLENNGVETPLPGVSFSYSWFLNGAELIGENSPTLRADRSGVFRLVRAVEVDGQTCSSEDQVTVTIGEDLTLDLPLTESFCEGEGTVLDAGANFDTYQWFDLTRNRILGTERTQEISEGGSYRVSVGQGVCNLSSEEIVVMELARPNALFTSSETDRIVCLGESINFMDQSISAVDISSYRWNFGDGEELTTQSPTHTYNSSGEFLVTLHIETTEGCTASNELAFTVFSNPSAQFNFNTVCVGESTVFGNSSVSEGESLTYSWDFDDNTQSSEQLPTHLFEFAGSYDVQLEVEGVISGCTDLLSRMVTVNALPLLDLEQNASTCGTSLTIPGPAGFSSYRWFDAGLNGITLSRDQDYLVNRNREVGLEVENANGCRNFDTIQVVLNTPISIDLDNRPVCGSRVLDAGNFPNGTYEWYRNDVLLAGETTRELLVETTGLYRVDVRDQNDCRVSASVMLTVEELSLDLRGDQSFCGSRLVTLDAGANASSYLWSTGETTQTITVTESGDYGVVVMSASGECSLSDAVRIDIFEEPLVSFTGESVCDGAFVMFENTTDFSGGVTYAWDFGDGTNSSEVSPDKLYNAPGVYTVSLEATTLLGGCSVSVTQDLEIYAVPEASFSFSSPCDGESVTFSNTTPLFGISE